MNIEQLFKTQENVDNEIAKNMPAEWEGFGDYRSLMHRKFAFRVEVMELANEIGFFKDWKHSHTIDKGAALEELADCMAFLLSIGNTQGYNKMLKAIETFDAEEYAFGDLFDMLTDMHLSNIGKYTMAFGLILGIGLKLGAIEEEIVEAYNRKAAKNITRQAEGY